MSDPQPLDQQPPDQRLVTRSTLAPEFDERLSVPLWWWPLAFGVAILLAAEVHLGYPGIRAWLPYLLTVPLAVVVLLWMGRHRVILRGAELSVGPAHIPVHALGQVEVISRQAKRRALGPERDPAAFVLHTGWVGPVLRIAVNDAADPTPYWIFSVRRAEYLAALLCRTAASQQCGEVRHEGSPGQEPG